MMQQELEMRRHRAKREAEWNVCSRTPGLSSRRYPYVRKRRNSDKILSFRINPTKLYML